MALFTLCGFTLRDDNTGSPPALKATSVDSNKNKYSGIRHELRSVVVQELGTVEEIKSIPIEVAVVSVATAPSSATGGPGSRAFDPYKGFHHSTQSLPPSDGKSTTEAELRALQGRQRAMRGGAKEGTITELQVTTAELYNAKMKADAERAKAEEAEMEMEAEKEQTKVPGDGMLLSQTLKRNLESQARR